MASIVKSMRYTEYMLAKSWEASLKLGIPVDKSHSAVRLMFHIGIATVLGPKWDVEPANFQIMEAIQRETAQNKAASATPPTSQELLSHIDKMKHRASPTPPASPDTPVLTLIETLFSGDDIRKAKTVWEHISSGSLTPNDQLTDVEPVCSIAAKLLAHTIYDTLSDDDKQLVDKLNEDK